MKRLFDGVGQGTRVILVGVAVLAVGVGIGLSVGPKQKAVEPVVPSIPTSAEVAAAPHPSVGLPPDPPATETSRQTVLDEEPPPSPSVQAALPPPATEGQAHPSAPVEAQPAQIAPPAVPAPPKGELAWQRNALPTPPTGGKPMIAVIIDDMGVDKRRSDKILQLPGPLTISIMTYAEDQPRLIDLAHQRGDELMMHVPMEPMAESVDPGPDALLTALPPEELKRRISRDLDRFSGYVGINNHMGSKFTAFAPGMSLVMAELRRRGLLFIDSLTTEHSVGLELARHYGVATAGRNVFLDNAGDIVSVDLQLSRTEELARKRGSAIAIGHPRDATIQALAAWLPTLEQKGFVLVPVTTVVRSRMATSVASTTARGE